MANSENAYQNAQQVKVEQQYRDAISVTYSLNGSRSLTTALGTAIPDNAAGVKVYHGGTVTYAVSGGASASNAAIPSGYVIYGGPDILQNVRLYASGATAINLVLFVHRSGPVAAVTT